MWLRVPIFLAVVAPFLVATGFHAPWWQVFLVALAGSAVSQGVALVVRRHGRMAVPVLVVAVAGAVGGPVYLLLRQSRELPFYVEADAVTSDLAGRHLRLHGYAQPGSIRRGPGGLELRVGPVPVRYAGVAPDTLRDGMEIVAAGRLDGGVLVAEQLLVKCPSNYDRSKGPQPF